MKDDRVKRPSALSRFGPRRYVLLVRLRAPSLALRAYEPFYAVIRITVVRAVFTYFLTFMTFIPSRAGEGKHQDRSSS